MVDVPIKPTVAERLGKRVAALRKKRRLLQGELGCSAFVICRLERGDTVPSVEKLDKIARALKVTLPDLFDFDPKFDTGRETALERLRNRRTNALHRVMQALRLSTPTDIEDVIQVIFLVFRIKKREMARVRWKLGKLRRGSRSHARS